MSTDELLEKLVNGQFLVERARRRVMRSTGLPRDWRGQFREWNPEVTQNRLDNLKSGRAVPDSLELLELCRIAGKVASAEPV